MTRVTAANEASLAALELADQLVHHRVERAHCVARHRARSHDGATTNQGDFAYFALGDPAVGLLDESDLSAFEKIEVAVEVTNLFVDGQA